MKNWTDLPNNLTSGVLPSVITIAQDMHIRSSIGEDLYSELLGQVDAGTETAANLILLNGDDRLFRGIKSTLAWWVAHRAYPYLHSKVTPTGIQSKSTEESFSVDAQSLEIRRRLAKSNAEMYNQQLICYLKENDSTYPLFRDGSCCTELKYDGYGSAGLVLDIDKPKFFKGLTREDLE